MRKNMKKIIAIILALTSLFAFAACGKDGEETVLDGFKMATNDAVDYKLIYPDDWEVFEDDGVIGIRLDVNPSDALAEYASVTVTTFGLEDPNELAKAYWEKYEKDIKDAFPSYEKLDEKDDLKLDGVVALKEKYKATVSETAFVFDQIICVREGNVYLVTLTVKEADYDKVSDAFEKIRENFIFK